MRPKSMGPFWNSLLGGKRPPDPWDDWRFPFEFFGLEPDASLVMRMDGGDPFAPPFFDALWARLQAGARRLRGRPSK